MSKKKDLSYQHWLVIGDWSDDGHGDKQFIAFRCTHPESEVKAAYKAAVKKGGVALHDDYGKNVKHVVCCDYEDSVMSKEAREALEELGVNIEALDGHEEEDGGLDLHAHSIAVLFMEMVKTQIEGFDYNHDKEARLPMLNGYWAKDFNYQFGYGTLGQ